MALTSKIQASIAYKLTGVQDLGQASADFGGFAPTDLQSGVADNQVDVLFSDRRTLAASASEDLDLAGTLLDVLGGAAVFAKVKAIAIKALPGNTNNVVVGGAATNAFIGPFGAAAHTVAIPPGGSLVLCAPKAGWTVTAATADLLKVANSGAGTSVTFEIVITGTSV